jgi:hypothetical protein
MEQTQIYLICEKYPAFGQCMNGQYQHAEALSQFTARFLRVFPYKLLGFPRVF